MREFNYRLLKNAKWSNEILGFVSSIHELKGKQDLYMKQNPAELEKLVEIAKVQSTEASNSIEGIRTTDTRLKQLLSDKTTPKNRDEEEIAGYRDALNVIHESNEYISVSANYILQLHKIMYSHSSKRIGGSFKNVQNYISATGADGKTYLLFTPLSPFETPIAINDICKEFNMAIAECEVDPLILIPIFIHDFLCIHPFLDGNGRMSRLLTTLLLYKSGYVVGKYISLEAKIAKNKDLFYAALEKSQIGWHEGKDNPEAFIKYLLSAIVSAYRDFEERASLIFDKSSAIEIVRKALENVIGKFTKSRLMELCPTVKTKAMEKTLKTLQETGEIIKHGAGKSTFYTKNQDNVEL